MKRLTNMTTKFTNFDLLKSPDLPNPGLKDWNRYLTNYNTWSNKFDKLKDKVNPTIEELETFSVKPHINLTPFSMHSN